MVSSNCSRLISCQHRNSHRKISTFPLIVPVTVSIPTLIGWNLVTDCISFLLPQKYWATNNHKASVAYKNTFIHHASGISRGPAGGLLIFSGLAHISGDWGNVGDSPLFHMSLLPQQASPGMFSRWWQRHKSSKWKHTRLHQHHDSPSLYHVQLAKTHHKPTPMSKSPFLVREMQWHTCRESEKLVPLIQSLPHTGLGWARHEPCAHTWVEM